MLYTIHNFISDWDFDDLFNALQQPEDVYIDIDSTGGNLRSAWKIYDAIRSHNGNVFVNVSGDCMSAAILVLLAAKPENRTANANAEFLIHKPLLDWWGLTLTDEDCVQIHEEIQAETTKLKDCYMERTNATEQELDVMINSEQVFGIDLAINLGFINRKNEYINKANKKMKKNESKLENFVRALAVKAGLLNQKEFKTTDDKTLIVETDDEPKVGDETPSPDGLYLMPDGKKITVADGIITTIETSDGEGGEDDGENLENEDKGEGEGDEDKGEGEGDEGKGEGEGEDEKDTELNNLRIKVSELQDKADSYDRISALVNKCGGEEALTALLNSKGNEPKLKNQAGQKSKGENAYDHIKNL